MCFFLRIFFNVIDTIDTSFFYSSLYTFFYSSGSVFYSFLYSFFSFRCSAA